MDLIDRQAAIATAVSAAIDWHRLANPQYSIAYCIGEAMRQLPSVQPQPEIVRCKDCKYYNAGFECLVEGYGIERDKDWYCADAERRTNERMDV